MLRSAEPVARVAEYRLREPAEASLSYSLEIKAEALPDFPAPPVAHRPVAHARLRQARIRRRAARPA